MKNQRKPLMLAYIIFLIVCVFYNMIAKYLDWDFQMWNPILVGVTVASYFFTLSSNIKNLINRDKELLDFLIEEKRKIKEILVKEETLDKKESEPLAKINNEYLAELEGDIKKTAKGIKKIGQKAFALDVVGYLVFFCIIVFPEINRFFLSSQDTITMTAFVAVLLNEYIDNIFDERFTKRKNKISTETNKLLDKINKAI